MKDLEIIKAGSYDEAVNTLYDLYPNLTDFQLVARRNEAGKFSKTGHTFQFSITLDEEDYPAPEELGEDEY
jgi:hypothetical protein